MSTRWFVLYKIWNENDSSTSIYKRLQEGVNWIESIFHILTHFQEKPDQEMLMCERRKLMKVWNWSKCHHLSDDKNVIDTFHTLALGTNLLFPISIIAHYFRLFHSSETGQGWLWQRVKSSPMNVLNCDDSSLFTFSVWFKLLTYAVFFLWHRVYTSRFVSRNQLPKLEVGTNDLRQTAKERKYLIITTLLGFKSHYLQQI